MRQATLPLLLSLLALPVDLADAVRVGITGRRSLALSKLHRRASLTGTTGLADSSDITYTTNITLGGNSFSVIIDTGSSDLYVTGTVPGSKDTGKSAGVQYAIGQVQGPVMLGELEFAGYSVGDQAYLDVPASTSNIVGTGLVGLGPNNGSQVLQALGNSSGDTVLNRIFQQNTSTPNFLTILLGRDDDPSDNFPGDLTVGEILPGYDAITSQPKLNVSLVPVNDEGNQHWQTLLDAGGIIGPDGKAIDVETAVESTSNKNQLTAVFDSGFSLPQVPASVSEAIYSDVPGAQLVKNSDLGEVWTIPCNVEINISFSFGGKTIPIHPLDTSLDLNATDDNGNHICIGAFQPISTAASPDFDMVLGMAFLRNTYFYVNYGDFVDGGTNQTADPYIQLLSTTNDSSQVQADFVKVRGNPQTWDPSGGGIRAHLPLIIGVSVAAGVLILALIAFFCLRNRRLRKTPAGFMNYQSSYQPLHEPAPPSYDMSSMGGGGYGHPPPQHANYGNPWDAHY
ncbi:uncharacterized protein PHACADRAFT_261953 [Phanerochaete carnosa HHB-10118-sp]|uniref:Peptidase A1 domain-containing protein n=1 Tax=Phanerochaete carnosa (strain HHB-10118-sp) TaxID=650164 RepID=K5WMW6_PHACS|nr:uncharacterized protein PHACADRAFT_261953 [Phanerochaete carnosa HHB-10118-sp]EKM51672.1 hypothetical protein PHACADRAFT_261953 [Phanerochaete carnosa HHB-10118-sp]